MSSESEKPSGRSTFFGKTVTLRQKMTARFTVVAVLGVAAVLWMVSAGANAADSGSPSLAATGSSGSTPEARPVPVTVVAAVPQASYERKRSYTGAFVATRESRIAFERPGRIVRLLVDEGATVTAGQPLAELDRRHLTAKRRGVAARLAEAQATLDEYIAGPRKQTIASAEALVRSLEAQRESAEMNLSRRQRLVESQAISREEYDDAMYLSRSLAAQVDQAQKELDELLAGTRKEQIAAQRARVDQLRAELADLDHDIEDTTLTAPFDGIVAERLLDEGAIVAAGEAAFRLLDDAEPELWVGLPTRLAARLRVGDAVQADVNGVPVTGTVRSLRPELDPTTRTRNAVFKLDENDLAAVPGQIARIEAVETIDDAGYWTPTDALTPRKRGLWAVYVAEGEGTLRTVAARDVEVLHTDGDRSFVRGTLAEGDAIIATGAHRVVEGQQVTVRQQPAS